MEFLAKERPVGFYHTGPRLRSSDLEITELFKRFCPRPVMVIVDVRASGGRGDTGIPTDAYFAVEEIRDVSSRRPQTHATSLLLSPSLVPDHHLPYRLAANLLRAPCESL